MFHAYTDANNVRPGLALCPRYLFSRLLVHVLRKNNNKINSKSPVGPCPNGLKRLCQIHTHTRVRGIFVRKNSPQKSVLKPICTTRFPFPNNFNKSKKKKNAYCAKDTSSLLPLNTTIIRFDERTQSSKRNLLFH